MEPSQLKRNDMFYNTIRHRLAPLFVFLFLVLHAQSSFSVVFDLETMQYPEIKAIKLVSYSKDTHSAVFNVTLYNPNLFKIPVREMTSEIFLNEHHVASLDAESNKSLAANAEAVFSVPLTVEPEAFDDAIRLVLMTGTAHYQFVAYLMSPVGEIPFTREGQLSTQDIMTLLRYTLLPELKSNSAQSY